MCLQNTRYVNCTPLSLRPSLSIMLHCKEITLKSCYLQPCCFTILLLYNPVNSQWSCRYFNCWGIKSYTHQTDSFICKKSRSKVQGQFFVRLVCGTHALIGKTLEDVLEDDDEPDGVEDVGEHCKGCEVDEVPDQAVGNEEEGHRHYVDLDVWVPCPHRVQKLYQSESLQVINTVLWHTHTLIHSVLSSKAFIFPVYLQFQPDPSKHCCH